MIDPELLNILACPETKEPLALASEEMVEQINLKIGNGAMSNRKQQTVTEKIDGGLVREDKKYLYPIRDDIPIMLIDEAIPLQ